MSAIHNPQPATGLARLISYLVNLAVLILAGLLTWLLGRSLLVTVIVVFEVVVVFTIARAATGRSPGAWATRTVAFAVNTDHAPGLVKESVRTTIQGLLQLTLVGPVISAATSRHGQDFADRAAGTAVLALAGVPAAAPAPVPVVARREAVPAQAPVMAPRRATPPPPVAPPAFPSPQPPTQPLAPAAPQRMAPPMAEPAVSQSRGSIPMIRPTPPASGSRIADQALIPEPVNPAASLPRAWATLDSGQRIELSAVMVFGRDPSLSSPDERAVAVPDPTRSVSRTHLRLGVDEQGLWLEDADSANGTTIIGPDGRPCPAPSGVKVRISSGTEILIGDRRFTVRQESPRN